MIDISTPALEAGIALGACSVIIGIAMRFTSGPLIAKVSTASSLAACAVGTPMLINSMQGEAKRATFDSLPNCITVEAVVADDKSKSATLILNENPTLRTYQIAVDDRLRGALADAIQALDRGDPAILCKHKPKGKGKQYDQQVDGSEDGKMHIDPSLFLKNIKENRGG